MQHRRRRHLQRGMTLLEIMIVLAILAIVMGLVVGPRVINLFAKSKGDTTAMKVKKYAHEAYPSWAAASAKPCPDKLTDLNEYVNDPSTTDTWGRPLEMSCNVPGVRGLAVWSNGADGQPNTDDDIRSWQ